MKNSSRKNLQRVANPKSFAALHDKGFRTYFCKSTLAMMADSIEHVISYWIVYEIFQSPALLGFASSPNLEFALIVLFFAGFLELAFNAMIQTIVQIQAPEHIRGRVIGLYIMASLGLRAFSGITIGIGGGLIGIQ
jgi:hypothetical protein